MGEVETRLKEGGGEFQERRQGEGKGYGLRNRNKTKEKEREGEKEIGRNGGDRQG